MLSLRFIYTSLIFALCFHQSLAFVPSPPILPIKKQKFISRQSFILTSITQDSLKQQMRVLLKWQQANKAALFLHRGYYYLVFNKNGSLDPKLLHNLFIENAKVIAHKKYLIVKLTMHDDNDVSLRRVSDGWSLVFGQLRGEQALSSYCDHIVNQHDFFKIKLKNNSDTLTFVDPDNKEKFIVITDDVSGCQIAAENPYYSILPTLLGMAMCSKTDHAIRYKEKQGALTVLIPGSVGIGLFSYDKKLKDRVPAIAQPLLELNKYNECDENFYVVQKEMRTRAVFASSSGARIYYYTELAKLYLANCFFYESLGILKLLKHEYPDLFHNRDDLVLMYDLANVCSHKIDYDELLSNQYEFEDEPEREVILGLLESSLGHYSVALQYYTRWGTFVQQLPVLLRNYISLYGLIAAVETKFSKPIFQNLIQEERLTSGQHEEREFYLVKFNCNLGKMDSLSVFRKLANSANNKITCLSRLELINPNINSTQSVIEDLEEIRFLWRGGKVEQKILLMLTDLYVSKGDYSSALRNLRMISNFLWKLEDSDLYIKRAQDLFYKVFLQQKESSIINQIGFYYEFSDVIPKDDRYLEIIAHLVGLYTDVELYDEAIRALTDKLAHLKAMYRRGGLAFERYIRLRGVTLKKIAVQHIMQNRYQKALKIIKKIDKGDDQSTIDFSKSNLFIKAVCYVGMKDYLSAINILKEQNDIVARRLLIHVYMVQKEWKQVVFYSKGALDVLCKNKTFNRDYDDLVLQLAISLHYLKAADPLGMISPYVYSALNKDYLSFIKHIFAPKRKIDISKQEINRQLQEIGRYQRNVLNISKSLLLSSALQNNMREML